MRFGFTEFRLDVRTGAGETTHDRVAELFDVPHGRLVLLAAGRKVRTEDEARAAPLLMALGTAADEHLPHVPLWRRLAKLLSSAARQAADSAPGAACSAAEMLRRALAVAWHMLLSLCLPSRAPPLTPPPPAEPPPADAAREHN